MVCLQGQAQVTTPSNASVSGTCYSDQQVLSLTWQSSSTTRRRRSLNTTGTGTNNITFVLAMTTSSYSIKNIVGTLYKDPVTFPNADLNGTFTLSQLCRGYDQLNMNKLSNFVNNWDRSVTWRQENVNQIIVCIFYKNLFRYSCPHQSLISFNLVELLLRTATWGD